MPRATTPPCPGGLKFTRIIVENERIEAVAFTPGGSEVVSGGNGIRRWKIEDGGEVGSKVKAIDCVNQVVVSKDGNWIVTGDSGNKVIVYSAKTRRQVLEVQAHTGHVSALDISSDSRFIASGSEDTTVRVLSMTSGGRIIPPLQHSNPVIGVKFAPSNDRLATAARGARSIQVFGVLTGEQLFTIPFQVDSLKSNPRSAPIIWSPDGEQVFAASTRKIASFDVSTSSSSDWSVQNEGLNKGLRGASITTSGRFLAHSTGYSVSFYDPVSQKQIGPVFDHADGISSIAISPNERYLVCVHDGSITVHDLSEVLSECSAAENMDSFYPEIVVHPLLIDVSDEALESWTKGDLVDTETILSEAISHSPDPISQANSLAYRAIIRARLQRWSAAIGDAEKSLESKPLPIARIALALSLMGNGEQELAMQELDCAFLDCDKHDTGYLLLIKAVLLFVSGKREEGIGRAQRLIDAADKNTAYYYYHSQVLGSMYVKQGDYERAIRTFERAKHLAPSEEGRYLATISLIFGWTFDRLEVTAIQQLCDTHYQSRRIDQLGKTLQQMVSKMSGSAGEKEEAYGRILQAIVTRSGETTLLAWTGRSSSLNSCLPASPTVYYKTSTTLPDLEAAEMEKRVAELRKTFSQLDALLVYVQVARLQPARFAHFRLHLPCIVFPVKSLSKDRDNVYRAKAGPLGEVGFTATANLLSDAPRLVLVNPWIHELKAPRASVTWRRNLDSDGESDEDSVNNVDVDDELVRVSTMEEAPPAPSQDYICALQFIARLGQPFTALLLQRQPDGSFKRVAADHEIVIPGLGSKVPRDLRAEVLEVL